MRIATVGSCLSKRTAKYVFFAHVANAVYHNRSDRLLETLLSSGENLKTHDAVCSLMNISKIDAGEFSRSNILRNQSKEGFGLHRLKHGINFSQALSSDKFDMVLIDNFMDIAARTYRLPTGDVYFCRYPKGRVPKGFVLGNRLTPEESAANFCKIVDVIRKAQPDAQIIFIHFPVNNYPVEKQGWANVFLQSLKLAADVQIIPPRPVVPHYPHKEPQHFRSSEYVRYAIHVMLLHVWWRLRRLWKKSRGGAS